MKTRRISTHRIGTDSKSRKRGWKGNEFLVIPLVMVAVVLVLFVCNHWLPDTESIVQITMIATASPLPTATATLLPPTVTVSPVSSPVIVPSPAPVVAPVFGITLGDVWLRKTAGGEMLPAALLKGQRVEILEDGGKFLKVQWTDGETVLAGWVTAAWVEVQ